MAEGDVRAEVFFETFSSVAQDAAAHPFANAVAEALARRVNTDTVLSEAKALILQEDIDMAGVALSRTPEEARAARMERLVGDIREVIFGEGRDTPPGTTELRIPRDRIVTGRVQALDSAFFPADLRSALEEDARHPVVPAAAAHAPSNGTSGAGSGAEKPSEPRSPVILFKPSPLHQGEAGDGSNLGEAK